MKRIKKGDTVIVTTGKSFGHIGKVTSIKEMKITVEGANLVRKAIKPNPNLGQEGGFISISAPIHISNVAIYNPDTKKADKVGFKYIEEAGKPKKVRYFKSNEALISNSGDVNG